MWNVLHSNRKCNDYDKLLNHQFHLERIVSARPALRITPPPDLPFLTKRLKKEEMEKGNRRLTPREPTENFCRE